jgi:hypothetical protein
MQSGNALSVRPVGVAVTNSGAQVETEPSMGPSSPRHDLQRVRERGGVLQVGVGPLDEPAPVAKGGAPRRLTALELGNGRWVRP